MIQIIPPLESSDQNPLDEDGHPLTPKNQQKNYIMNTILKHVDEQLYLGVEFDDSGIAVETYFQKLKKKFTTSYHQTAAFCREYKFIPAQRLTVYKSVVRSRIEYAAQVVMFTPEQIQQFETIQQHALKKILDVPQNFAEIAILMAHDVLPIKFRFDLLKLRFVCRLQHSQSKMVRDIFNIVRRTPNDKRSRFIKSVIKTLQEFGTQYVEMMCDEDDLVNIEESVQTMLLANCVKQKAASHLAERLYSRQRELFHQKRRDYDLEKDKTTPNKEQFFQRHTMTNVKNGKTKWMKIPLLTQIIDYVTTIHERRQYVQHLPDSTVQQLYIPAAQNRLPETTHHCLSFDDRGSH